MPDYTTDWAIPKPGRNDYIAASNENLRTAIGALADRTDQSITQGRQQAVSALDPRLTAVESVAATAPHVRGTLDGAVSLDSMTAQSDNGYWTVSSAGTNPGLPATPGVPAKLTVENTANDKRQVVTFRSGGGTYERIGVGSTWGAWVRTDGALSRRGTLPADTDLNTMRTASWIGMWTLSASGTYGNLPPFPTPRPPGMLIVATTGVGDTWQRVIWRYSGGVYEREQTGTSSFSDWRRTDTATGDDSSAGNLSAALAAALTPSTGFEQSAQFTPYEAGDGYMDWLAARHPDLITVLDLGPSRQGRPIRAMQLGDPDKPALYLMMSQHGDEPMAKEAALTLARELADDDALNDFWEEACVVITPVVNVDKINVQRLSSSDTDLNRNWATRTTAEIQAVSSVLDTHDVVLCIDGHEGGNSSLFQTVGPTAPGVHHALQGMADSLTAALDTGLAELPYPHATYPGEDVDVIARNAIALEWGATTMVYEGPSLLHNGMYVPPVQPRHETYLAALHVTVAHFRDNLADYVAAKADASA